MKLMDHQLKVPTMGTHYCFFWDCGTGKTLGLIHKCATDQMKTLVLCPKSVMECAWLEDSIKYNKGKRIQDRVSMGVCWSNKPKDRQRAIHNGDMVIVTNYETFRCNVSMFEAGSFERLIVDESVMVKNPKSAISKAVYLFADKMKEVFCLSGMPAPNCKTEYWGHLRTIGVNSIGSYWRFVHSYFTETVKRYSDGTTYRTGWKLRKDQTENFEKLLKKHCWAMSKDSCVDLPGRTDIIRENILSAPERKAYKSMLDDLRLEFENGKDVMATSSSKWMKLRQICNGFVYGSRPVTKPQDVTYTAHGIRRLRPTVETIGDSKLKLLKEIIEEIGPRRSKIVIWAEYTKDINRLTEWAIDAGLDPVVLDGRTKNPAGDVRQFQGKKWNRVCIAHPAAAGHGLTLTAANYAIFYGLGWSADYHKQARDRIDRKGQTLPCTFIYLLTKGTLERRIFDVLQGRMTQHEAMATTLRR